jgi:hypothetical protein
MMDNVLSGGTGSFVIPDGTLIDIPGPEVDLKQKPCRVTATLRAVHYLGDNIGSKWRYYISVNNTLWSSDLRIVHCGTWDYVDKLIYDNVFVGGCGLLELVTISVRARECDRFLFDHIGYGFYATGLPCLEKPSRSSWVVILVPVPECPEYLSRLWRWLFRKDKKVALLHFVFEVTAQCVIQG